MVVDQNRGQYSGPGVSDNIFNPATAGIGEHIITYQPPAGVPCAKSSYASINVVESTNLNTMPDHVIVSGQSTVLQASSTNAVSYEWDRDFSLNRFDIASPVASPDISTTYWVTAKSQNGCTIRASVWVQVLKQLNIPNAFTPNGDNINDIWEIEGLSDYTLVNVQVFNRWGTLVYMSEGYRTPWNGTRNNSPLPAGTYYYVISTANLPTPLSGSVAILR